MTPCEYCGQAALVRIKVTTLHGELLDQEEVCATCASERGFHLGPGPGTLRPQGAAGANHPG